MDTQSNHPDPTQIPSCFAAQLHGLRQQTRALPPEQLDRYRRSLRSCDLRQAMGSGQLLCNRIGDDKKQRFVEAFVSANAIDGYPAVAEDLIDENDWPGEGDIRAFPSLRDSLRAEVARAFARCDYHGYDPGAVATDLLCSEHGTDLREIQSFPLEELSAGLLLAHLEALGFGLPERVSASIARRALILLHNRKRWFQDARASRKPVSQDR